MAWKVPTQRQQQHRQVFPFLQLPKAIRLKIYDHISLTTRHHTLYDPTFWHLSHSQPSSKPCVALITKSLSVSILLVSRQLHTEALPYLAGKLIYLQTQPLRFIVDSLSLKTFIGCGEGNLMAYVREHCLAPSADPCDQNEPQPRYEQCVASTAERRWYKIDDTWTHHIFLFPTVEHAAIDAFVARCAAYIVTRRPKGLVVAVRKHDGETEEQSIKTMLEAFCWSEIFVKVDLLELGIEECAWIPWGFEGKGGGVGGEFQAHGGGGGSARKACVGEVKSRGGRRGMSVMFDKVERKEKREWKDSMSRMKMGQRNASLGSICWEEGEF